MLNDLRFTAPLGKSHHSGILFNFNCYYQQETRTPRRPLYHKGDYINFGIYLQNFNWKSDLGNKTCAERWEVLNNRIQDGVSKFIPHTKPGRYKKPKNIWMTQEALEKIRAKNRAFKTYCNDRSVSNYNIYSRMRNQAKWECNKAKKNFEKKIAAESKKNPKGFYKYVNQNLKTRPSVADLEVDGKTVTEDQAKAEILNEYFSSVFTRENTEAVPNLETKTTKFPFNPPIFSEQAVLEQLKRLKPSKSPGPDELHPYLLRELSKSLALPLSLVMQSSFEESILPQDWKDANVSPIFKKGKRSDKNNYRPVSLTSIICKVMETIVRNHVMDHLTKNNMLSEYQHGFVKGRSCSTQLLQCLDKWTEMLDNSLPVDIIYLDFAKAFDSVPHIRLISKIKSYGIEGKTLAWIDNFLKNRRQRVVVNGSKSSWNEVVSGVPQGSEIGPSLFVIYINDIPSAVKCFIQLFADDTKIFRTITNTVDQNSFQKDLDGLSAWSQKWQLNFNATKCKVIHFGQNNLNLGYNMDGSQLEVAEHEKDLGVVIDNDLSFDMHINQKVLKANRVLGLIRRSFTYMDKEILVLLYKSMVRPHLEYCHSVTFPMYDRQAKLIEGVQRRATKLLNSLKDKPYIERLRELKLPTLHYRRRRGDLIEAYKYTHGLYTTAHKPLERDSNTHGTRGHNFKLKKLRCKKNMRQHYFSLRVTDDWNNLSYEVVNAPSLDSFKSRLDKFLRDDQYKLK